MYLYITIPAINEFDFIIGVLTDLSNQKNKNFTLLCCVNQPDDWWNNFEKIDICKNNVATLNRIKSFCEFSNIKLILIDKCSQGNGWRNGESGVGWARKTLMDKVAEIASEDDIIVSLDADTRIENNYTEEIEKQFNLFEKASALALPYFHRLQGDDDHKVSMLRYEIYLRCYSLNLLRINFPYSYTPIGSAMAARVSVYRKIKGLTATSSGEDFYFMMKLRKAGVIIPYCNTKVFPSARKSNRVIFGTGPTVALGAAMQAEKYPIYSPSLFSEIENAVVAFGEIFITKSEDAKTKALSVFPDLEPEKLLQNNPLLIRFIHACYTKADAFAVYKFVKANQQKNIKDIDSIRKLAQSINISFPEPPNAFEDLHLQPTEYLKNIRKILVAEEEKFLQKKYNEYFAQRNNSKNVVWKFMS